MRQLSEIEKAYLAVFDNRATVVMVLRDLVGETGFMAALPKGADASILIDHNARRAVFGRIYEILSLTSEGRATLAEAMREAEQKE